MYLWNLIELAGLRRVPDTRTASDLILTNVFSRISVTGIQKNLSSTAPNNFYLLPLDVFKNVLNMVPRKRIPSIVKKLQTILEEDIEVCLQEWPIYFQLRALFEINAFPFDVDYLSLDVFNE